MWRDRVQELAQSHKYAMLFAAIGAAAFLSPLFPEGSAADGLITVLVSIALLAGIFVVARMRRWRVLMFALVGLSLALNWIGVAFEDVLHVGFGVRLAFFGTLSWLVFVDVLYRPQIRVSERLFGAAAVYIIVAFAVADAYLLVQHLNPDAFTVTLDRASAAYYSFATQTTLGYGDIAPVSQAARTLASMQATVGLLYITITVARLASMDNDEEPVQPEDV